MLMFVVIGLNVGTSFAPPFSSQHPLIQPLNARELEQVLEPELRSTKDAEQFMIDNIKMFERGLNDRMPYSSAEVSIRYTLIRFREFRNNLTKKREVLEAWFEQRQLNPDSPPSLEVFDHLIRLDKEDEKWMEAWNAGRIAPMPREMNRGDKNQKPGKVNHERMPLNWPDCIHLADPATTGRVEATT